MYPQLKPCVAAAVDRAIRDLIQPVVHSSVAISRITACEIVPKDFSRDPDDNKMRNAAHLMGRNLAGNLALVTCKERLRVSMSNHLKTLLTSIPGLTEHFLIERACTTCALENLELGCNLIKEAATRKAKASIDEALLPTLNMRKRYKQECGATNRPFFDSRFMYKSLAIPEALKPAPGGLQVPHLRVYEAFNRPVGQPLPTPNSVSPNKMLNKQTAYQRYMVLFQKLTVIVQSLQMNAERPSSLASIPPEHDVWRTLNEIHETGELTQPVKDRLEAAHLFSQHVFKIMYSISRNYLQLEMHLLVLARLLETFKKLKVEITSWVMFAPGDDKKFNREIAVGLIQANLLQLGEYDAHIAQMLHKRRDKPTIDFAAFLITKCVITERIAKAANFPKTLDELTKVSMTDAVKYPHVAQLVHKLSSGKEKHGGLILARWLEYHSMHPSATTEQVASVFLPVLEQSRVLSADQNSKNFFGSMIRICVERSHLSLREKGVTDHTFADAFAQILWMIIKFVDKRVKIQMFAHAFSSVAHVIVRDYNAKAQMWDQRPYLRIFVSVLHQLNQPDPAIEPAKFRFYEIIERVLHNLRPENVPGFTFAWLDLIAHRTFMPKLLLSHEGKGWRMIQRLIVDLLETLKPYLEKAKLTQAMRLLYKSTLRVLLVLLKDFPEFLCNFHFSFCNAIPASCIQLRNLVLSAFPRGMRLPDPFTPNLKVDRLPEIRESPQIMSDINVPGFDKVKVTLDQYLEQQAASDVFHVLRAQFFQNDSYNIPLINAIVLYVGMQATNRIEKRNSDHDLFQLLAEGLDAEGRYHFVNAIANQLRYPNNQTHYFSCVLLLLFGRTRKEILQEQITRVLLERLIVQRPHPWGLLITFIELIKNPSYSFWDHGFTRCAPEIRRLFVSVASSCMGPAGSDSSIASNPNSVQS